MPLNEGQPATDSTGAASNGVKPADSFVRNTIMRFATAGALIPVLLWLMYWSPWYCFQIALLSVVMRASHELMRMTMNGARLMHAYGVICTGVLLVGFIALNVSLTHGGERSIASFAALPQLAAAVLLAVLALVGLGPLLALLDPQPIERAGLRAAWIVAGPFYIGLLMASLGTLHFLPQGGHWVLLAMMNAWLSDTGAYFAGRFLGKHKLAPRVSPSKTVEGGIGGLAGSLGAGLIAHFFFLPQIPLWAAILVSLIAGAFGQMGDLIESLIKRSTGVKDSGSILPGHGGLLDRIDALMYTSTAWLIYALLA